MTERELSPPGFGARIFLRSYGWFLQTKKDAQSAYNSAAWTVSLFGTILVGFIAASAATLIGVQLRLPLDTIIRMSQPNTVVVGCVLLPVYLLGYCFLRSRFRRFLDHPETAKHFHTGPERTRMFLSAVALIFVLIALEVANGLTLKAYGG
jgi:hypothetical protein